jgi:hypothetical protein
MDLVRFCQDFGLALTREALPSDSCRLSSYRAQKKVSMRLTKSKRTCPRGPWEPSYDCFTEF